MYFFSCIIFFTSNWQNSELGGWKTKRGENATKEDIFRLCCPLPLGLHVKSTLLWPPCCRRASPAKRKPLWRDCRTTISSSRRQNREKHRSNTCTVKSCCCSVAPPSSALRNCEPNGTLRRLHRKPGVKKKNPASRRQTDAAFNWGQSLSMNIFYCDMFCHPVINIVFIVVMFLFGWYIKKKVQQGFFFFTIKPVYIYFQVVYYLQ